MACGFITNLPSLFVLVIVFNQFSVDSSPSVVGTGLDSTSVNDGVLASTNMKSTGNILQRLRALMISTDVVKEPIQAYIIPSTDAHNSEYIAASDQRRKFVSGFSGSAGMAIVTEDKALMWTDGRYFLQASNEMDDNWTLMKEGLPGTPTQAVWLTRNLPAGSRIGVDPMLMSFATYSPLDFALTAAGHTLVPIDVNLVDSVWDERPAMPREPVTPLEYKYTGKLARDKVLQVREKMTEKNATVMVVTALDQIAWLLNLRGSDIEYNPVFFAYVILTMDRIFLFIDQSKICGCRKHFQTESIDVEIQPYDRIKDMLVQLASRETGLVWIGTEASYGVTSVIPKPKRLSEITQIELLKAVKNPTEVQGMIKAHIRDGVALCCYFSWLEKKVHLGNVTEISGAEKLEYFRKRQTDFVGLSFPTISSSGPNGAVIHYHPNPTDNRVLTTDELYLCDSGAQYKDGTTDVTRTVHFGTPSAEIRERFTLVFKGQVALQSAVFPKKIKGNTLDTLARKHLWDQGYDYAHGTSHGIGMFLNVHEGPMGISWRENPNDPGLEENMFMSNEPGFYKDGEYGIRIEDIVRIVKANVSGDFNGRGALTFETVTMAPIQTKLLDIRLLTEKEIKILNNYHENVRTTLGPLLKEQGHEEAFAWLQRETTPI